MGIRQEKFAGIIQQHLSDIFLKEGNAFNNAFITISKVEISADLGYAKVFLSFLNAPNKSEVLELINFNKHEIRKKLAQKTKNQARIVPELNFVIDDSLDYVFHMEKVMQKVKEEDAHKSKNT
jgi:ribosome-binding factor A